MWIHLHRMWVGFRHVAGILVGRAAGGIDHLHLPYIGSWKNPILEKNPRRRCFTFGKTHTAIRARCFGFLPSADNKKKNKDVPQTVSGRALNPAGQIDHPKN
jgi:hypothetical protein